MDAIERAAKAMFTAHEYTKPDHVRTDWDVLAEVVKQHWRMLAQVGLEAASNGGVEQTTG